MNTISYGPEMGSSLSLKMYTVHIPIAYVISFSAFIDEDYALTFCKTLNSKLDYTVHT